MSKLLRDLLAKQNILMDEAAGAESGGGAGGAGEGAPGAGDAGKGGAGEGAGEGAPGAGEGEAAPGEGKPSEAEAKLLKELMKWKDKAKTTASQAESTQGELASLRKLMGDKTPEEIQGLIQAQADAERKQLEARGEYDRILQQVREQSEQKISEASASVGELKAQLSEKDHIIENMTVGRGFSESPFVRENSALPPSIARNTFGAHFDVVEGQVVAFDKPRGKEGRTPLVDASGNNKGFDAAIEHLYRAHPDAESLIKSKAKPGAGSKTVDQSGAEAGRKAPNVYGASRIQAGLDARSK